jgi:hypothetical protein
MPSEEMIPVHEFCMHHHVEQSFVYALEESGLIEIDYTEEACIHVNNLHQLEKLVRLNTELDINIEGIEAIAYLLQRIHDMQQQITQLHNRLSRYENE